MEKMIKKIVLFSLVLVSTACQQLQHGEMQPVKLINPKEGIYLTTCAGAVEDWPSCYDKASKTCNKSYSVLIKEDNSQGTKRNLIFKCNK